MRSIIKIFSFIVFISFHDKSLAADVPDLINEAFFQKKNLSDCNRIYKTAKVNVYLCKDIDQQKVAVKILLGQSEHDEKYFNKEVKIQIQVHSPGTVQLYDYEEFTGRFYAIMEYCSGGTLYDLIESTDGLSEDQARLLFSQIAQTLAFLHKKHIAHRDIKPENFFLLEGKSTIKVGDFGMSLDLAERRPALSSKRRGTASTMALEVHRASKLYKYDPYKADVFSLGALLATAVLGHQLYGKPGDKFHAMLMKYGAKRVVEKYAKDKKINLSENFVHLVSSMMAYNPADRPTMAFILQHPWFSNQIVIHLPEAKTDDQQEEKTNAQKAPIPREHPKKSVKSQMTKGVRSVKNYFKKTFGSKVKPAGAQ